MTVIPFPRWTQISTTKGVCLTVVHVTGAVTVNVCVQQSATTQHCATKEVYLLNGELMDSAVSV